VPINTPDLRKLDRALTDIGNRIDGLFNKSGPKWLDDFFEAGERARNLSAEIGNLQSELSKLDPGTDDWRKHNEIIKVFQSEVRKAEKEASGLNAALKGGASLLDKFGRGIISVGLGGFTIGMQSLSKAIYKVWDVLERATKVAGEFAMQVGAASGNFKSAQKFGSAWEGTIRGMTDAQGQGMKMAADFIETFDRMPLDAKTKEGNRFAKMQLGMARGFNLGGEGAAELADTMRRLTGVLGDSEEEYRRISDKQAEFFKEGVAAAKAANVPVNKFFKEIAKAGDFFLEVGESGRKGLTTAIGFVKKLGVSVADLKKFTDTFDTFDDTAKNVAKLNTVFGTTINAMGVMLEQDPGKRFEIIRQQLKGQGKAFADLSRMEKKIIAETTGLSVKSIQGMLDSGLTLEEFEKRQEKAQERKLKAEEMIRNAMAKTATTMFAFKAAWDQVFMAVTKLIKPFTDVLGLTKSGEKGAKSFGQVMDGLFKRLIKFIEEVAANKDWQGFMKRLAKDAVDLASKISSIATGPGLGDWIKTIVKAGSDFYDIMKGAFGIIVDVGKKSMPIFKFIGEHIKEILAIWAGGKIASMGMSLMALGGMAGGGAGALAGVGGRGLGVLGGFGAGAIAGGGSTGGMIGAGVGSMLGIINPFLGLIGGAIGGVIGKKAEEWFQPRSLRDAQEARKRAEEELKAVIEQRQSQERKQSAYLESLESDKRLREIKQKEIDDTVRKLGLEGAKNKQGLLVLDDDEKKTVKDRIDQLKKFGLVNEKVEKLFGEIVGNDGPIIAYRDQIKALSDLTKTYNKELAALAEITTEYSKKQKAEAESRFGKKKHVGEQGIFEQRQVVDDLDESLKKLDKMSEYELRKRTESMFGSGAGDVVRKRKGIFGNEKDAMKALLKDRYTQELDIAKENLTTKQKELQKLEMKHSEELFNIRVRDEVLRSEGFTSYLKNNPQFGSDMAAALSAYASSPEAKLDPFQKNAIGKLPRKADGGIVTAPTRALVGEAGPEAIVPLKALVSGGDSLSTNAIGAAAAANIVNLAQGRAGASAVAGGKEVSIEVPIYLDSTIIGRAVSRSMLSDYEV
jgi:hypothetical protein